MSGTVCHCPAGLAERHTRWSQTPLSERTCGFESHTRHPVGGPRDHSGVPHIRPSRSSRSALRASDDGVPDSVNASRPRSCRQDDPPLATRLPATWPAAWSDPRRSPVPTLRGRTARRERLCRAARLVSRRRAHHRGTARGLQPAHLQRPQLPRGQPEHRSAHASRETARPTTHEERPGLPRHHSVLEALALPVPTARTRPQARATDRARGLAVRDRGGAPRRLPARTVPLGRVTGGELGLPSGGRGEARYDYPRWQFTNNSADIRALCSDALDLVRVAWRQSNWKTISVSRRRRGPPRRADRPQEVTGRRDLGSRNWQVSCGGRPGRPR